MCGVCDMCYAACVRVERCGVWLEYEVRSIACLVCYCTGQNLLWVANTTTERKIGRMRNDLTNVRSKELELFSVAGTCAWVSVVWKTT